MIHMNNDLPSPHMVKPKSKSKESPMVIAHFNKAELANMDKMQGGRTMDKKYGIPHYNKLGEIFKNPNMLARAHHANGGSAQQMEHMKAKFGQNGDTERAAIPRHMADYMDRMGMGMKNSYTGDQGYAMGSNFLSSLGSLASNFAGSGAGAGATPGAGAAPTSGSTSTLGSLFNTLAPAAIDAGAKWLSKPSASSPQAPQAPQAPQQQQAAGQGAPQGQTASSTQTASNPSNNAPAANNQQSGGNMDMNSMMQQLQQMAMQHGQNYLNSRSDPYSQMASQLMNGYQKGGFQGMMNPQAPQGGYEQNSAPYSGGASGYAPGQYQPPAPQQAPAPAPVSRRPAPTTSRRTSYR